MYSSAMTSATPLLADANDIATTTNATNDDFNQFYFYEVI